MVTYFYSKSDNKTSMNKALKTLTLALLTTLAMPAARAQQGVTPSNALQHYIHAPDPSFRWEVRDSFTTAGGKGYDLLLTSQKWRQYVWTHQLTVLVPDTNTFDGALLFITGGHNKDGLPGWKSPDDKLTVRIADLAARNHAITAIVRDVPNEPLYDSLTEDALISYTLHRYKGDTTDYTWPLLFPMVTSAVRAMDAVQQFASGSLGHPVHKFVVSGASKRGWTTWLTGANDPRVEAIGPMVIDVLNMPKSLAYQIEAFGKYSVEINDYVKLGIVQGIQSPSGRALATMIDPYSYRKTLTMPKMLFMGTNDPYWVIDNVKNYLPDIPGFNLLHYVPNAGHGLGDGNSAFNALSAFFGETLSGGHYPVCSWKAVSGPRGVQVKITATRARLTGAVLWHADSRDRDFRNDAWTSRKLDISHVSHVSVVEPYPASGYHAFYVDLIYTDPNGGEYTVSTRAFMTDTRHIL